MTLKAEKREDSFRLFLCYRRHQANVSESFRAFHLYLESLEMLSVFVFVAKRMVKGAATLTSFALGSVEI